LVSEEEIVIQKKTGMEFKPGVGLVPCDLELRVDQHAGFVVVFVPTLPCHTLAKCDRVIVILHP
jgi:hypothetical protein